MGVLVTFVGHSAGDRGTEETEHHVEAVAGLVQEGRVFLGVESEAVYHEEGQHVGVFTEVDYLQERFVDGLGIVPDGREEDDRL